MAEKVKDFYPFSLLENKKDMPLFSKNLGDFFSKIHEKNGTNFSLNSFNSVNGEINEFSNYWDIIYFMDKLIEWFIKIYKPEKIENSDSFIGFKENIFSLGNIDIKGLVSVSNNEPVIFAANVKIRNFVSIEGPAFIGENTLLDNAIIKGPIITGRVCKLSGEIENSFIMDYVNKHHYGFIGHSILESWVNLGAGTTNSDLKNNYSKINIYDGSKFVDSGKIKLGCIIGQHTKTAIGTLINTGTVIGPFCNIIDDIKREKHIKPFSWGKYIYNIDKLIESINQVMERRQQKPDKDYIDKIKELHSKLS